MAAVQACNLSGCRQGFVAPAARRPSHTSLAGLSVHAGQHAQQQHGMASRTVAAERSVGRRRPGSVVVRAAAAASPAVPSLDSLEFCPVIDLQGYVSPHVPEGTEATVFAVYDDARTLQYVGFSKGLRDSLRSLFSRRPDKAHYYKALHLPRMDQQQMLEIRSAWFDANYGPPPGNKLPAERDAWQAPAEAHVISERGKGQAAAELAKQLQARIKSRGCKEEFVAVAELLADGRVDFLPAAALTPEELARNKALAEEAAQRTRACAFTMDGQPASFDIFFRNSTKTNGGYMFDVSVTFQDKETQHRIIVGRDYYEPQGIKPQTTVERVFAFLLARRVPRQTEGLLLCRQFSSNYFSVSQVEQTFDDFADEFAALGKLPGDAGFWRFNRTQDYAYKGENETPEQLTATFGSS